MQREQELEKYLKETFFIPMQTPWDCSRNDTKEVPLNSVQKCLNLICRKKTSFFFLKLVIISNFEGRTLNMFESHPGENTKCARNYPFFFNVGIISNFEGMPLKVFESHLQVKISNVQENIQFHRPAVAQRRCWGDWSNPIIFFSSTPASPNT